MGRNTATVTALTRPEPSGATCRSTATTPAATATASSRPGSRAASGRTRPAPPRQTTTMATAAIAVTATVWRGTGPTHPFALQDTTTTTRDRDTIRDQAAAADQDVTREDTILVQDQDTIRD